MYLIGNWKMEGSRAQLHTFLQDLEETDPEVKPILCLPALYLENAYLPKGYQKGGQDCSSRVSGPFTGQISARMLKEAGCSYTLVGHPERAAFEPDEEVHQKALRAQEEGLTPIVCLSADLKRAQKRVPPSGPYMIAYEPAVGANAPPENLDEAVKKLRAQFALVLYGGAVNPHTIEPLIDLFDGFLVGRASLDVQQWQTLLKILSTKATADTGL